MATTVMAAAAAASCCATASTSQRTKFLYRRPAIKASGSRSVNQQPLPRRLLESLTSSPLRSAAIAALSAASVAPPALPALAEQIEKAALFDFNLTLPAIALEFLLLMVALDKIYFTPLGKFMDERDAAIREKLGDVKDTSTEVKQLEDQAAAVMKAARAEISAALNQMKKETTTELEQKLAEGRKKVEAELTEALQALEKQKEDTIKALDSQIAQLSDEIVKKVLPTP